MKRCVVGVLLWTLVTGASSMVHTLMYFETTSSQISNFPEYVSVGYVDGLQITHYDSVTKREEPKQEWMNRVTEYNPQYWEEQTQNSLGNEQVSKVNIETFKQRLNVSGDSHIDQWMFGCEWDDVTGDISGYYQSAFDGEDFISLDYKTETWVAAKQQAVFTKQRWESSGVTIKWKNYIDHRCAEYLKKHVRNGESVLKRTERPLVSLLQKSPSAPVTCHATGFYPDRALMFWTKDGEELEEGVDPGEILPNHDGTFQTSVDLDVSSVPPEDWDRYKCVFQLSGVKEDLLTRLERAKIRTNQKDLTPLVVAASVVLAAAVFAVVGFLLYRRVKAKRLTPPPSENGVEEEALNRPEPQVQGSSLE